MCVERVGSGLAGAPKHNGMVVLLVGRGEKSAVFHGPEIVQSNSLQQPFRN